MTGSDSVTRKYIRWDASGVEKIPPGEPEDIQEVADMINFMQKAQYDNHWHMYGGTHARTQGLVKGELIVGDLPPHVAQSLFSNPSRYPIAMRYSTELGDPALDDRIPQPRGLAMKVFNVSGQMFAAGQKYPTQDIEFNSTPVIELADAKNTKEIFELRIKYGGKPDELQKHLGVRKDADLQKLRDNVRNTRLESIRYYSQSAYRYGDYVVKYCLVPSSETQKKLYEEPVKKDAETNHVLSDLLKEFYSQNEAEYLFQVQLLENLEEQPVEYAGKEWDVKKFPWQTVAKLLIPKHDSFIPARKSFWEDHIRLDPWHGLKSLQPLGSANRLRRAVYPASAALRRKTNGRKEVDVTSIDQIPDNEYVDA